MRNSGETPRKLDPIPKFLGEPILILANSSVGIYKFRKELIKEIVKKHEVIAASIMLATNGRMNYHLSGSLREYSSLAPTNLLLYKAALWGVSNGYKSLYLGGGVGSGEDGLFKFKRSFYKGELNHFYIGKKIYDFKKYDVLIKKKEQIKDENFFPRYRG